MLTRKYFPALQKTEILPENPVSETSNHTLDTQSSDNSTEEMSESGRAFQSLIVWGKKLFL